MEAPPPAAAAGKKKKLSREVSALLGDNPQAELPPMVRTLACFSGRRRRFAHITATCTMKCRYQCERFLWQGSKISLLPGNA